jgi:hypothetical protein
MKPRTFLTVLTALTLLGLPALALNVQIDFADADTDSSGNWNNLTDAGGTNLTDFDTGLATTVDVSFTGSVSNSTSTGQWGTRSNAPSWTSADALSDRLFISEGDSGTLTLTGLTPGLLYDIEIASSYGGGGTSGNAPALYELTDANGLVEGFNALTSASLGTTVSWEPRLLADSGTAGVEGWLGWYDAEANGSGELSFSLSAPDGSGNPRIALNAMQITAIPEPSVVGLLVLGFGIFLKKMRRANRE